MVQASTWKYMQRLDNKKTRIEKSTLNDINSENRESINWAIVKSGVWK